MKINRVLICSCLCLAFGHVAAANAQSQASPPPASSPATPPPAAAAPPPPTPVAFDVALLKAANDLLSKAKLDGSPDKVTLVIDPLIDGVTGSQSNATHLEERRVVDLVKSNYPRFQVARFSSESIAKSPIVLIGTFTAVNNAARQRDRATPIGSASRSPISGPRRSFPRASRAPCLTASIRRRSPSLPIARYSPRTRPPMPTSRAARAPRSATASIRPMPTASWWPPWSMTASRPMISGRYRDALDVYQSALKTPGGEQLRVLNGIYLANYKLHRTKNAMEAFGKVVDYGLKSDKLAVKFLFKPGSTQFTTDRSVRAPYDSWLEKIAERTAANKGCLEVVGHTSATGLAALNDPAVEPARGLHQGSAGRQRTFPARKTARLGARIPRDDRRNRQGRCQRRARSPGGIQGRQMRDLMAVQAASVRA